MKAFDSAGGTKLPAGRWSESPTVWLETGWVSCDSHLNILNYFFFLFKGSSPSPLQSDVSQTGKGKIIRDKCDPHRKIQWKLREKNEKILNIRKC